MDTRSGRIHRSEDAQEFRKKGFTELTPGEFAAVQSLPEAERPAALAMYRFVEQRRQLGGPMDIGIKNAFRMGYLAARKDMEKE